MQRKISFAEGEFYHIYNRGTDKRTIYLDEHDFFRFQFLLYICNGSVPVNIREQFPKGLTFGDIVSIKRGEELVDICAYCLMPNHFHILVRAKGDRGISQFFAKLSTAYSMYFNKRYGRSGGLFEGTFKALHVENDDYLKYLLSYIHLNPIKIIEPDWRDQKMIDLNAAKNFLNQYRYSSYKDFLQERRPERLILNRGALPEYFQNFINFEDYIDSWLTFDRLDFTKV